MSSDDIVISVSGLSKNYRVFGHPGDRIKQALTLGRVHFHREFQALTDISFSIRKGETVGIIGRNGSGKSTLLQLVCGILKPTSGSVEVTGRISALLELGTGFHAEFTGRENVFFQGAVMGFSPAQMGDRFDGIAAFADIGEFIDQPVRTYSSGMYVRLAFAVAVHTDPDILVVDEALAVGDARFQAKCFRHFEKLKERGATLLVVSHATELITRICDRAVFLDRGQLVAIDDAATVVDRYLEHLFSGTAGNIDGPPEVQNSDEFSQDIFLQDDQERFPLRPAYNSDEHRWGNRKAAILDFNLIGPGGGHATHIDCDVNSLELILKILFLDDVHKPVYGLMVKSKEGQLLCAVNSMERTDVSGPRRLDERIFVSFSLSPNLEPGDYFISVGVSDASGEDIVPLDRRYDSIHLRIVGRARNQGYVNMSPIVVLADPGSRARTQSGRDTA